MEVSLSQHDTALRLANAALDKKALDPVILHVEELLAYCSHFVVLGGSSGRQVRAIANHVLSVAKDELGLRPISVEGLEQGKWVLVDLGDVVVHVFDGPLRGFYDLEGLWREVERVPIPGVEDPERDAESQFAPAGA